MNATHRIWAVAALALGAAALSAPAFAAYPDKPIRARRSFRAGRRHRHRSRARSAAGMSKELGKQVIVDNKPGAGTIIGTDAVAKSAPDGYNIVIATFAHAVNPSLQPKLPYRAGQGLRADHR